MGQPAARITDKVMHPLPGVLLPGTGSMTVITGNLPSWRGLPALAAMALQAAKAVSDVVVTAAETATAAAAGTPGAPAAIIAEKAVKTAASAAMAALMNGLAGASAALTGGTVDKHICLPPPLPPHGLGMVIDGSSSVLVNGLPFCAKGDHVLETLGGLDEIMMGCPTVLVGKGGGGMFAALMNLVSELIAKALAAIKDVAAAIKDAVNFVKNLVNAVVDGLLAAAKAFGEAVIAAVIKALTALAAGFAKAIGTTARSPVKTGLGDKIDALANKSPKLASNLEKLQKDGWTIKYGPKGGGTFADRGKKEIVVDEGSKDDAPSVVQSLAHESGHGLYTEEPYVAPDGLTKNDYVEKNVTRNLKDEGEATLTNAEVRHELLSNGGDDIGIAGAQSEKYQEVYEKYPDPADRDKARDEIGKIFAEGETPSGDANKGKNYHDYYAKTYEDHYDKVNPPK